MLNIEEFVVELKKLAKKLYKERDKANKTWDINTGIYLQGKIDMLKWIITKLGDSLYK